MNRLSYILILTWILFRFIWHTFDFDNSNIATILYYVGNDLYIAGFALLMMNSNVKIKGLRFIQTKRLLKTILIYALWLTVVDILVVCGVGTDDTILYTSTDIAILALGTIWAIIL